MHIFGHCYVKLDHITITFFFAAYRTEIITTILPLPNYFTLEMNYREPIYITQEKGQKLEKFTILTLIQIERKCLEAEVTVLLKRSSFWTRDEFANYPVLSLQELDNPFQSCISSIFAGAELVPNIACSVVQNRTKDHSFI